MKKHGRHHKRYGAQQQARFFVHNLNQPSVRAEQRRTKTIKAQSSDRIEMLRGWLRVMSKEECRTRVVAIYGEAFAAQLEFLK
jgi:hypothetical protein